MSISRKIYNWAARKASSPFAPLWLGLIFLLELVFFIPLDAILVLFCLEDQKRRFWFALLATFSSLISAVIGYFLGYLLWDTIGPYVIGHLISADFFEKMVWHYQNFENWAVFIGSFLPIPFKAVSLSAGFCQLSLLPFMVFVVLGRLLRFMILAKLVFRFGKEIKAFIDRHADRFFFAIGAKIALALTFLWILN